MTHKKIGFFRGCRLWVRSVRGLIFHIKVHAVMSKAMDAIDKNNRASAMKQLRDQEGMIGHSLLHVIGTYPIGSGAFISDDEDV